MFYGCLNKITSITNQGIQVDYSLAYDPRLQVATAKINGIVPDENYSLLINF